MTLLAAARRGDAVALANLLLAEGPGLVRAVRRVAGRRSDEVALLQEAVTRAVASDEDPGGEVGAWLRAVATRTALDHMEREEPAPSSGRPDPGFVDRGAVQSVLGQLDVEQRAILALLDVEGWPVVDAARMLDLRAGRLEVLAGDGRRIVAEGLGAIPPEGSP